MYKIFMAFGGLKTSDDKKMDKRINEEGTEDFFLQRILIFYRSLQSRYMTN